MYSVTWPDSVPEARERAILTVAPDARVQADLRSDPVAAWDSINTVALQQRFGDEGLAGLLKHAVDEAFTEGDRGLLMASDPSAWTPLAPIYAGRVGKVALDARSVISQFKDLRPGTPDLLEVAMDPSQLLGGAVVTVRLPRQSGDVVAAMAIHPDAFIASWPRTAETLTLRVDNGSDLDDALEPYSSLGELESFMLIRSYTGTGTWVRDMLVSAREGSVTITRIAGQAAGVLVGRFIKRRARQLGTQRDDFVTPYLRRLKSESASELETACPAIDAQTPARGEVVVVVHGTMSTGHELAEAMRVAAAGRLVPILRFEHDTWHTLDSNVQELVRLIRSVVRNKVHLVGHSRGGLVTARVADILSTGSGPQVGGFVTLGTPFWGTPMAAAADVATQGWNFTVGWVSRVADPPFGPMSFAVRGLLGICLKLDVPAGLRVMLPAAGELPMIRERLASESICIAGAAVEPGTYRGPLSAAAAEVFETLPNDMVVATDSARPSGTRSLVVSTDHFSYPRNEDVDRILREFAAQVPEADPYPEVTGAGFGPDAI